MSEFLQKIGVVISSVAIGLGGLFSPTTQKPVRVAQKTTPVRSEFVAKLVRTVESAQQKPKAAPVKKIKPQALSVSASSTIVAKPVIIQASTTPERTLIPAALLNERVRESLVNILCITKTGGYTAPISGSGVIIDPRGVVLTNAHVAEYFFLKDFQVEDFISCQIRAGSPAQPAYTAKLIFFPRPWLIEHAREITKEAPTGTGENDYALLAITGSAQKGVPLPSSFPALTAHTNLDAVMANEPVIVAGYPAEFAGDVLATKELYQASSINHINGGYYFSDETRSLLDLISLGSTILAQGGSSGGPVVSQHNGSVLGIVVTTTSGTTTASKNLYAISSAHINRSIIKNSGKSLGEFLSVPIPELVSNFEKDEFPSLKALLIKELERN